MKFFLILLLSFQIKSICSKELLDKIIAVINDEIITLSQIKRIHATLLIREQVIRQIYNGKIKTNQQIVNTLIDQALIRNKLKKLGFSIKKDDIERSIKHYEDNLRISRRQLIQYLKQNNLSLKEYSDFLKEGLEFNRFNSWFIRPLVSITDQDIKNAFYKEHFENKTLSFKYHLTDYTIPKKSLNKKMLSQLPDTFKKYKKNKYWPEGFSNIQTLEIGIISEESLAENIKAALKNTSKNNFTGPVLIDDTYHFFFIKNKTLLESELYLQEKPRIYNHLFEQALSKVREFWLKEEKVKNYVRTFF